MKRIFFWRDEMGDKGKNITKAIQYVQSFYEEVAQLFIKLDDLMGYEGWTSARGNTTTSFVSKDLLRPKNWLPEGSFRLYENKNFPNVRKGVTVCYIHKKIDEPLLLIGFITYDDIINAGEWDLWYLWFWDETKKELGEDIFEFTYENEEFQNKIRKNGIYALNLVDIKNEDDIKEKVFGKLLEL